MCLTCPDRASSPPRSPTPLFPHNQQSSTSPPVSPTDTTNAPPPPTARSVVVSPPPARVRATASRGVEGARSQVAVGESGRGGARNAPAPATPGGPALISVCARAATESQRGRRGAQRGDGGGGVVGAEVARKRGVWTAPLHARHGFGGKGRGHGGELLACGRSRATESAAQQRRRGSSSATDTAKRRRAQSFRSSSPCISDGREGGGPPQWRA